MIKVITVNKTNKIKIKKVQEVCSIIQDMEDFYEDFPYIALIGGIIGEELFDDVLLTKDYKIVTSDTYGELKEYADTNKLEYIYMYRTIQEPLTRMESKVEYTEDSIDCFPF